MPTLVEELKKVENHQQKTKELEKAILLFVEQPNIYNTLKKAASNEITVKLNNDHTCLEAKGHGSEVEPLGYRFAMYSPHQTLPLLITHISFLDSGVSVRIEYYSSEQLPKEHALRTLKTIIGLDEE